MDGGNNRNIGMLGYEMPLGGWWRVGAQYLLGHDETEPGGSGGVFSLSRGEENSWEKGTSIPMPSITTSRGQLTWNIP